MLEYFGDRRIALCRELTKVHEEVQRTTLSEAVQYYKENKPRGEFVLIIEGAAPEQAEGALTLEEALTRVGELAENGMRAADACREIAKVSPFSKGELYSEYLKGQSNG